MFIIDGIQWPWPCDITRASELTASDISGLLLNREYFNDVLGQYMRYEVTFIPPLTARGRNAYAEVYELLTAPVDGHEFILPYNNGTVALTGRVENVRDKYVRLANGETYWKGTVFTVIANHPTRALSLSETLTRGRAPLPDIAEPAEGDTYTWKDGAWGAAETYPDADDMEF